MTIKRVVVSALFAAALGASGSPNARAATSAPSPTPTAIEAPRARLPHASLRIDVGVRKGWVGQSIPITVKAYFRGVDGATLEGTPQLTASGLFTSDLASAPHQATEIIAGEPVLVATWTGSVTPSSPGVIAMSADLPVRVRYRDAAPEVVMPDLFGDDPFAAFGRSPFDSTAVRRLFEQSTGRVREETTTLRAVARATDAMALPIDGQPATFTGAVGRFDLHASVSSSRGHVSDPLTLRIVVDGTGDLDRVDLAGVATSDTWKAYPPKSTIEPATSGRHAARKVFEQILVPLRGGDETVPSVSLTSFDPVSSRYVTRETAPLAVTIEGVSVPEPVAPSAAVANVAAAPATPEEGVVPTVPVTVAPATVLLRIAPAFLLVVVVAILARLVRKRSARVLHRTMRSAADQRHLVPFYRAAHSLIAARLGERWKLDPGDVTIPVIRARLGDEGEPLVEVLAADEALRFGRASAGDSDLGPLCMSIERALGGVS